MASESLIVVLVLQSTGKKSTAKMNKYGDRGSPCFTPFFSLIFLPVTEFITTYEFFSSTACIIHIIQFCGNYLPLKFSSKNPKIKCQKSREP
jgi:hypothetical protein